MRRTLVVLTLGLLVASSAGLPARAQETAAPAAPAAGGSMSINAALQGGYELKSVAMIDSAESKLIWSNDVPQTIVTLEKGPSLLICVMATANWANAIADRFSNASLCQAAGASGGG